MLSFSHCNLNFSHIEIYGSDSSSLFCAHDYISYFLWGLLFMSVRWHLWPNRDLEKPCWGRHLCQSGPFRERKKEKLKCVSSSSHHSAAVIWSLVKLLQEKISLSTLNQNYNFHFHVIWLATHDSERAAAAFPFVTSSAMNIIIFYCVVRYFFSALIFVGVCESYLYCTLHKTKKKHEHVAAAINSPFFKPALHTSSIRVEKEFSTLSLSVVNIMVIIWNLK